MQRRGGIMGGMLLVGALWTHAAVHAEPTVTKLGGSPTTGLIISQTLQDTGGNTTTRYRASGSDRDLGQSFTPSSEFVLDKVVVRIGDAVDGIGSGAPGAAMSLELYSIGAGDVFTLLQTYSGATLPSTIQNLDYLTFDILDTPPASGTEYAFLLLFDQGAAGRESQPRTEGSSTNTFAGGTEIRREFGSGTGDVRSGSPARSTGSSDNRDMLFYLIAAPQASSAVEAVPEPGTLALAGLGGLILLGIGLRRRMARRGAS
jgi:hypothetical protein